MTIKSAVFFPKVIAKRHLVFGLALFLLPWTAQVKIFLPFTPIPIVLQNVAILSFAALLGQKMGPLLALSYVFLGILGLPVFSQASPGIALLSSPTSGYLLGYIVASYVIGKLFEKKENQISYYRRWMAFALSTLVIDLFGFLFLSSFIGPKAAFTLGVLPFLFIDFLKISLAAFCVPQTLRIE